MTLLQKRDAILESLHTQFKTKIGVVLDAHGRAIDNQQLDRILLDVANNAAQGIADDGESDNG